ncbi:MAG: lipid A export permease/ATP-binding protein MsbA [Nevskiales bacterium]|nr:lipid A export permease/ATP-binding protein MsbA [Nevskiales bacterium]
MSSQSILAHQPLKIYRRLLGYALPNWRIFVGALLCMAMFAGTEVAVIQLIKPLTDGSFVERDPFVIKVMPFAIVTLFLIRAASGFGSSYGMAWLGQGVVAKIRCQVFEHLLFVPVAHHDKSRNADLQAKLTFHANQVAASTTTTLSSLVKDGLTVIGLLATMFYMSWRLAIFVFAIAPVVTFSLRWVNKRFRRVSSRIQQNVGEINHVADEAITGRRIVKIYGGESTALEYFRRVANRARQLSIKITATSAASSVSMELIAAVGVSVLVYLATRPETLDTMTPGTFVAFIGAMLALRGPLNNLTKLSQSMQTGIVAAADLFAFLDTPAERDLGRTPLERADGVLRFDDVVFRYDPNSAPALDHVNLDVPAGMTVAFVGKSGSGKSTLLSLIPRFYDPDGGAVRLDGQDLRDYPLRDLRRQIALVDQNVVLFNATIGENISYGQPQATREQIEAAARQAFAWDFIQKLPQGLDTPIGQDGLMLSGGQRQRIAIARALLKDAPILILDEATSALDTESERYVQQALDVLKRGRTTLVIAHRLSTIQNADLIVVMQDGRIAEQGRHADLLAQGGVYAALHRLQFREEPEPGIATTE